MTDYIGVCHICGKRNDEPGEMYCSGAHPLPLKDARVSERTVQVRIVADTRAFRRELLKAQLLFTRRWWRRLPLRFKLWRVDREADPRG